MLSTKLQYYYKKLSTHFPSFTFVSSGFSYLVRKNVFKIHWKYRKYYLITIFHSIRIFRRTKLKLETLDDAVLLVDRNDDSLVEKHGCPAYVSPEILTGEDGDKYSGKPGTQISLLKNKNQVQEEPLILFVHCTPHHHLLGQTLFDLSPKNMCGSDLFLRSTIRAFLLLLRSNFHSKAVFF